MNKLYEEDRIGDIAEAIREKSGKEDRLTVAEMSDAIRELPVAEIPEELKEYSGDLNHEFAYSNRLIE